MYGKEIQVDGMLNPNICYILVSCMATNSDVIMASSVVKTSSDFKNVKKCSPENEVVIISVNWSLFTETYLYFDVFIRFRKILCRNSVFVGVQNDFFHDFFHPGTH